MRDYPAIALTGGMGMGKSTVAEMFVERGCAHYDADAEIATLYGWSGKRSDPFSRKQPDAAAVSVFEQIRPDLIVQSDHGRIIDRQGLIAAMLADPELLPRIEEAMTPILWRESVTPWIAAQDIIHSNPRLFDIPLMFEAKLKIGDVMGNHPARPLHLPVDATMEAIQKMMATRMTLHSALTVFFKQPLQLITVVVSCPEELQRERCMKRPGMTAEKFAYLTSRQMPDAQKRLLADYVIDTSESLEDVRRTVDLILVDTKLRGYGGN